MKIPTALYCRYSTDRQDARSLEDQERRCRAYATADGYQVAAVYADAAVSGATSINRQQLQRLLTDAKTRKFKAVIVDDLSRLSRDRVDSGVLVRQLDDLGVAVIDCETGAASDDESAEMVFGVKALINGEFIKSIRRQTPRGLEGRALAGFATGGKTYGYGSVEEPNPADPTKPRRLPIIDRAETAVVTRIFEAFADRQSPREIAQQLNSEKVPAAHDNAEASRVLAAGATARSGRCWERALRRAHHLERLQVEENRQRHAAAHRPPRQRARHQARPRAGHHPPKAVGPRPATRGRA